jgi:succinate-semialdehyde dehydrogenase/glutarate-semialdehyde dehydrogenase
MSHPTTLIGGVWQSTGSTKEICNPATGSAVGVVDYSGASAAVAAVDAAAVAFPSWADTAPRARARALDEAASLIRERADAIGGTLAAEAGKRLPEAIGEVVASAEYFRWFAEEVRRPRGELHPHEADDRRHLTVPRPAGVVASLTPWNFPCSIQARKLAPALAAGCTVVARVSEKAPLAVTEMFRCLTDAGLPDGVVNLVHGPAQEITSAYLSHSAVRVVSFTGSTAVGSGVMAIASRRIVRPLLELGGNAPFIVFDDADLDRAVDGALIAKFRNTGQSCIAANRFFVQSGVYDEFVSRFAKAVDSMTIGDGSADPVPDLAACIDQQRVDAVTRLVSDAEGSGATRVTRDRVLPSRGAFCAPALLVDVPDADPLSSTEVFGPAAAIHRFEDDDEVVVRANATEMGLAAYFYTTDQSRLWRIAEHLEAGIVGVNDPLPSVPFAPMGGAKQSGLGREGSAVGLSEFEESRYLSIRI